MSLRCFGRDLYFSLHGFQSDADLFLDIITTQFNVFVIFLSLSCAEVRYHIFNRLSLEGQHDCICLIWLTTFKYFQQEFEGILKDAGFQVSTRLLIRIAKAGIVGSP